MKTVGLLGGMSWESTIGYYRKINEGVKKALGGLHSAKIAMYSVDFEPIEKLQHEGDWEATAIILCLGKMQANARAEFLRIIDSFAKLGARGVILGCTEIGMLVSQRDTNVKLFDTTAIHAAKAVEYAIHR